MLLLIALGELGHGQVGVQPVHLRGLEVFEQEAVAQVVFDARTHAAAGQHDANDSLEQEPEERTPERSAKASHGDHVSVEVIFTSAV